VANVKDKAGGCIMQVGDLVTHKNLGGFGIITEGGIKQNLFRFLVMWLGGDTPVGCWYNKVWLEVVEKK